MSANARLFTQRLWISAELMCFIFVNSMICAGQEAPKVQDLCKLLREADRFDGKIVAIRGVLRTDFGIYGEGCKQVVIGGSKWPGAIATRYITPYQSPPAGSETLIDRKSIEALDERINAAVPRGQVVECKVVVVGILRSRDEKQFYTDKSGQRKRGVGFGHLGIFPAELLVVKVISFGEIRKIEDVPR